jgi:hypothetical protein
MIGQHHDTVRGFFAFVGGVLGVNFMAWLANSKDSLQGLLALVSIVILIATTVHRWKKPSDKE